MCLHVDGIACKILALCENTKLSIEAIIGIGLRTEFSYESESSCRGNATGSHEISAHHGHRTRDAHDAVDKDFVLSSCLRQFVYVPIFRSTSGRSVGVKAASSLTDVILKGFADKADCGRKVDNDVLEFVVVDWDAAMAGTGDSC